jgi:hypothetical protein
LANQDNSIAFSRVHIEIVNQKKVGYIADFAFGEYIATDDFFRELSRVQDQLINAEDGDLITLGLGQEVNPQSTGGLIAIQIYMEALESQRQAMVGLAKLGLNVEKQVWKNI